MSETLVREPQAGVTPAIEVEAPVVEEGFAYSTGWIPDLPDIRDYTPDHPEIAPLLDAVGAGDPEKAVGTLPPLVDLRMWFSSVEDQDGTNSCTAHAGVGAIEFFERRAFGRYIDHSRLFLYKTTRDLLGWTADVGAFLRTTMGSMVLFGVPPERYWPFNVAKINDEPAAFHYSFAENYRAIKYYRLDPPGITPPLLLNRIKTNLAAGLPAIFGFTVYSSIGQAKTNGGKIPYPRTGESVVGGHAVVAAGYDDAKVIKNMPLGPQTTGAILIRNSWGTGWGQAGYGWLPYEYVLKGQATDFWSLIQNTWVDTGQFGL